MAPYVPALEHSAEIGMAVDMSVIAGLSFIGDVGAAGLSLETSEASSGIQVSQKGLDLITEHLGRLDPADYNDAMIDRLRTAMQNGDRVFGPDADFYMHEANEATLMNRGLLYDEAHIQALERYGVTEFDLYHPEIIKTYKFNEAWWNYWMIPR